MRDRRVYVRRRHSGRAFSAKAARVGAVNDLYTLTNSTMWSEATAPEHVESQQVDAAWASYEKGLMRALDDLIHRPLGLVPADQWLKVLVPFVTSLFVRGPNFNDRFESRPTVLAAMQGRDKDAEESNDNTNMARLIEFQRLLAPIMAARWVVMHVPHEAGELITNDLAMCRFSSTDHPYPGVAIPVARNAVLGLLPQRRRTVVARSDDGWWAPVEHRDLRPPTVPALRTKMAEHAREFIVGSAQALVDEEVGALDGDRADVPQWQDLMGARHRMLAAHEFEWHRLISAIHRDAPEAASLEDFDADAVYATGWRILILPINLPKFPTGLQRLGGQIQLSLDEIAGFTDTYTDGSGLGLPVDLP